MSHRIVYPFAPTGRSTMQAVSSAERPAYALVAAYRVFKHGGPIYGTLRGAPPEDVLMEFAHQFNRHDIDMRLVDLWITEVLSAPVPAVVGSLTLSPYQTQAVGRLATRGGVLAVGCGLGKTVMAAAYYQANYLGGTVVVACPLNAIPTWKRVVAQGLLPADTLIVSVDSAHKMAGHKGGDLIIFDEAHMLGEGRARRTKACLDLRLKFKAGLCLTGTLLHSGIIRAMTVLDLAVPGSAGFASRYTAGEYFKCLVKKSIGGRTVTQVEKPGAASQQDFHAYLNSRGVVALTTQSAEVRATFQLPDQHIHDERICEPWGSIEDAVVSLVREKISRGEPGLMSASEAAHALCAAGIHEKVEFLRDTLADDAEPVVIGANYTASLDAIQAMLEEEGHTFVRVDGSVTGDARGECQRKFQSGEVRVFLGQASAAAVAMDLYRARYSIMVDHPWKPADYSQFLARTARRGQQHETHHIDLVANRIQKKVVDRLRAQDEFNAQTAEWQEIKRQVAS